MERVTITLCILVGFLGACSDQEVASSDNISATQAQASICVHAIHNDDNISFLNTCEYSINAVIFTDPPVSLQIDPHTSVDEPVNIALQGLNYAACRQPFSPQKEIEGTYSCNIR